MSKSVRNFTFGKHICFEEIGEHRGMILGSVADQTFLFPVIIKYHHKAFVLCANRLILNSQGRAWWQAVGKRWLGESYFLFTPTFLIYIALCLFLSLHLSLPCEQTHNHAAHTPACCSAVTQLMNGEAVLRTHTHTHTTPASLNSMAPESNSKLATFPEQLLEDQHLTSKIGFLLSSKLIIGNTFSSDPTPKLSYCNVNASQTLRQVCVFTLMSCHSYVFNSVPYR